MSMERCQVPATEYSYNMRGLKVPVWKQWLSIIPYSFCLFILYTVMVPGKDSPYHELTFAFSFLGTLFLEPLTAL